MCQLCRYFIIHEISNSLETLSWISLMLNSYSDILVRLVLRQQMPDASEIREHFSTNSRWSCKCLASSFGCIQQHYSSIWSDIFQIGSLLTLLKHNRWSRRSTLVVIETEESDTREGAATILYIHGKQCETKFWIEPVAFEVAGETSKLSSIAIIICPKRGYAVQ